MRDRRKASRRACCKGIDVADPLPDADSLTHADCWPITNLEILFFCRPCGDYHEKTRSALPDRPACSRFDFNPLLARRHVQGIGNKERLSSEEVFAKRWVR